LDDFLIQGISYHESGSAAVSVVALSSLANKSMEVHERRFDHMQTNDVVGAEKSVGTF
jgi:hypothetical protein